MFNSAGAKGALDTNCGAVKLRFRVMDRRVRLLALLQYYDLGMT